MQITYIANVRLPTEKAHGIQVVKMCEAFANCGAEVVLKIPRRKQINPHLLKKNIFDFYQVKNNFKMSKLANIDLLPLHQIGISAGGLAYLVQEISFSVSATLSCLNTQGTIYTRSKLAAFLLSLMSNRVIFESHASAANTLLEKMLFVKVKKIVCITKSIQKSWQRVGSKTTYAPDAVSKEFFTYLTKTAARKKLALDPEQKIIVYTGNLYPWKGIDLMLAISNKIKKIQLYIVGGSIIDKNIKPLQKKAEKMPNVHIIGHVPYKKITVWQKAADILILPNSAHSKQGSEDTSPLKLFEYLTSKIPIVAAKVPAVKEVVSEAEVWFFQPDKPQSLINVINKVASLKKTAINSKVNKAYQKAEKCTWQNRAQYILASI